MKTLFFILPVFFCTAASVFAQDNRHKFEPPDGKTILIVGQDRATIEAYMKESGSPAPAGFMVYVSIQEMVGLDTVSNDYGAGVSFADELLEKYPGAIIQVGLYMVDALEDTAAGKYDANIDRLARWCKKAGVPVFLRIGYEFDGPHNHYDPQQYKTAYRHIVDKLRGAGVGNVAFVWHAHTYRQSSPIQDWYPGDEYVDWVGISYFSQHPADIKPVITFAKNKGLPVMIAESTPKGRKTGEGEALWNQWYKRYFSSIAANNIKAACYINTNWEEQPMWRGQDWGDARVETNDFIKSRWREETTGERYLLSGPDLFSLIGYEP